MHQHSIVMDGSQMEDRQQKKINTEDRQEEKDNKLRHQNSECENVFIQAYENTQ